ncbi:hypothetical protein Syun_000998 [Stephania yunnanensis]|uniref:Uncharacterized protein n=1 Tax=Stephania yunnanensis TaxID=152371 RepID=A0AAP0LE33_9MAGN
MGKSNGALNNASSQTKNYEITHNKKGDRGVDGPAAPGRRIKEAFDSFMHAPLGLMGYSSVGRAPLLRFGRCNYRLDV